MSAKKSYHTDVMCNVCGKVMRDNNLKRHMNTKHAKPLISTDSVEAQVLGTKDASALNVEPTIEQTATDDCNEHNSE